MGRRRVDVQEEVVGPGVLLDELDGLVRDVLHVVIDVAPSPIAEVLEVVGVHGLHVIEACAVGGRDGAGGAG